MNRVMVYVLDNFEDYETHFTVMNYTDHNMTQVKDVEFVEWFEKEGFPGAVWSDVRFAINSVINGLPFFNYLNLMNFASHHASCSQRT